MLPNVLFVAFPGSGHTWLINCLQDYFGEEMRYCEYYTHCKTFPCETSNFSKNHDFNLDLVVPENYKVIVQLRNPHDAIASWYKRFPEDAYESFFQSKLLFYYLFTRKWMNKYFQVHYEDHITNRQNTLIQVINYISGEEADVDRTRAIANNYKAEYYISKGLA